MIPLLAAVSRAIAGGEPDLSYSAEVLADSPTHYWRLNDAASPAVSIGSASTSMYSAEGAPTFGGAALVQGGGGSVAFEGDASDDGLFWVNLNSDGQTTKTVEAVVRLGDLTETQVIVKEGGLNNGWALGFHNGNFVLAIASSGGDCEVEVSAAGFAVGDIVHLCGTLDDPADKMEIFVSKMVDGSVSTVFATRSGNVPNHNGSCDFAIGTNRCGPTFSGYQSPITRDSTQQCFAGDIAEVAIYMGTVLSAARIAAHAARVSGA